MPGTLEADVDGEALPLPEAVGTLIITGEEVLAVEIGTEDVVETPTGAIWLVTLTLTLGLWLWLWLWLWLELGLALVLELKTALEALVVVSNLIVLVLASTGKTVAVFVITCVLPATSLCGICALQNSKNCPNCGSTYACNVCFTLTLFASIHA